MIQCTFPPSFIILCLLVLKLSCWLTHKQTDAAENIRRSSLRYSIRIRRWVIVRYAVSLLEDDSWSQLYTSCDCAGLSVYQSCELLSARTVHTGTSNCKYVKIWRVLDHWRTFVVWRTTVYSGSLNAWPPPVWLPPRAWLPHGGDWVQLFFTGHLCRSLVGQRIGFYLIHDVHILVDLPRGFGRSTKVFSLQWSFKRYHCTLLQAQVNGRSS